MGSPIHDIRSRYVLGIPELGPGDELAEVAGIQMNTVARRRNLPRMAPCALKLRYYSKSHAKEAVRYYRRKHGWDQEYYWCEVHGCYHLTSVKDV